MQPLLVNENIAGPKMNPMKELYWQQFGGGPDAALLKRMDPNRPVGGNQKAAPRKGKANAANADN